MNTRNRNYNVNLINTNILVPRCNGITFEIPLIKGSPSALKYGKTLIAGSLEHHLMGEQQTFGWMEGNVSCSQTYHVSVRVNVNGGCQRLYKLTDTQVKELATDGINTMDIDFSKMKELFRYLHRQAS